MKVKPELYMTVLILSARLAPVVPDWSAARARRRVESGVRASFALRAGDRTTELPGNPSVDPHKLVN